MANFWYPGLWKFQEQQDGLREGLIRDVSGLWPSKLVNHPKPWVLIHLSCIIYNFSDAHMLQVVWPTWYCAIRIIVLQLTWKSIPRSLKVLTFSEGLVADHYLSTRNEFCKYLAIICDLSKWFINSLNIDVEFHELRWRRTLVHLRTQFCKQTRVGQQSFEMRPGSSLAGVKPQCVPWLIALKESNLYAVYDTFVWVTHWGLTLANFHLLWIRTNTGNLHKHGQICPNLP